MSGRQGSPSHHHLPAPRDSATSLFQFPTPIAKVVVSCFLSISTGMLQRWALSLPEQGPPGWSCWEMLSGRKIPSPASCPACPAHWVTLGRLCNLSGPLQNKCPTKLRPLLGSLGLGLISSSPGAGIVSPAGSRRPRLVLGPAHIAAPPYNLLQAP